LGRALFAGRAGSNHDQVVFAGAHPTQCLAHQSGSDILWAMAKTSRRMLVGWGLIVLGGSALAQLAPSPSGHWEGSIQAPNQAVAITVDLAQSPAGAWIGSMSIPMANAIDLPLGNISIQDNAVRFTIPDFPGNPALEGKLSADAAGLTGTVINPNGAIPFTLQRKGEANVKMPTPSTAMSADFEGTWEGIINAGAANLRMIIKLSRAADGAGAGTMTSVDQGGQEIPMSTVTIHDKQLQFEIRAVGVRYRGTLGGNGEITGEFSQGPATLPLNLKRSKTP